MFYYFKGVSKKGRPNEKSKEKHEEEDDEEVSVTDMCAMYLSVVYY